MDEIVKELREDKIRAWEMISFLKERLQVAEKQGGDQDLHKKMDKILEKLDKQNELERKVDYLEEKISQFMRSRDELGEYILAIAESVKRMSEDISCKELTTIKDSVLRTEGKVQRLWEDMDNLDGKVEVLQVKIQTIDMGMKKIMKIEEKIDSICETLYCLRSDLKVTNEAISTPQTEFIEQNVEIEVAKLPPDLSFDDPGEQLQNDSRDACDDTEILTDVTYKCYNSNCDYVFPKNLQFSVDGVSVNCKNENCEVTNIIGNLAQGHKWMGNVRHCRWHYQQYPHGVKHLKTKKCEVCEKMGIVYDSNYKAVVYDENVHRDKKKKQAAKDGDKNNEINEEAKEPIYKCFNANCNHIFSQFVDKEEDDVHVVCPEEACRQKNIVGKLKQGYKWVTMKCDGSWHFQQIPLDKTPAEHTTCEVCEKQGKSYAANDRTAVIADNLDVI